MSKHSPKSQRTTLSALASLSAALSGLSLPIAGLAAPTGESGMVGITNIDRSVANTTTINQNAQRAIINWTGFDIAANELVNFVQPDANAVALNRVMSAAVSNINGALTANGNVFLINPSGIVFGAGAQVDVGGLVATTLNIADNDFLGTDGTPALNFSGNKTGSISNAGLIEAGKGNMAEGGYVYLIAPSVNNSGQITGHVVTNIGTVQLAAGNQFQVSISGSGLVGFSVAQNLLDDAVTALNKNGVTNSGTGQITAQRVFMDAARNSALMSSVVNNSGVVLAATSFDAEGAKIEQHGVIAKTYTPPVTQFGVVVTPAATTATDTITLTATDNAAGSTPFSAITGAAGTVIHGTTVNLEATKAGGNIGTSSMALVLDADNLNAETNLGHIYLTDIKGGVALGKMDTGSDAETDNSTSVILRAQGGSITQLVGADPIRAWSTNLTAVGTSSVSGNIGGGPGDPLRTQTRVLLANATNGSVRVSNQGNGGDNAGHLVLGRVVNSDLVVSINPDNLQPVFSYLGASDDGKGNIRLPNGNEGVNDINITTTGSIVFTDTVSATRNLSLSAGGSILYADDNNPATAAVTPLLTGRNITLTAGTNPALPTLGDIGLSALAINTSTESLTANTPRGGVYVSDQHTLNNLNINASKGVGVAVRMGNVTLGSIVAGASDLVTVVSTEGAIIGGSGPTDITGGNVDLQAKAQIGSSGNRITTALGANSDIKLTNQGTAGIYVDNTGSVGTVNVDTRNSTVEIRTNGNPLLSFNSGTGALSLAGSLSEGLSFINNAGNLVLSGLNLGSTQTLDLTASGHIRQGSGTATAQRITLVAASGIGQSGSELSTASGDLRLTSTNGGIYVSNTAADLLLTGTAGGMNSEFSVSQTGNLQLNPVQATGKATLKATGTVTDGPLGGNNVTASGLDLRGSAVGTTTTAIETAVSGALDVRASAGGIYLNNTGVITGNGLAADATGDIRIANSGNAALNLLKAGGTVTLTLGSGHATDANGSDLNFDVAGAEGLTFSGESFGTDADRIEIKVKKLVIDTQSGGIYATNSDNSTFSLVRAKSAGAGSDIKISTAGSMGLGVVETRGNLVELTSVNGSINDARPMGERAPNVLAQALDLSAQQGVGNVRPLSLDVGFVTAAGGAGQAVSAANLSAVTLNAATLSNKSVSVSAPDITVLDNSGATINLQSGGTLTLTATSGNIVFINQADTLVLGGGGHITLTANAAPTDDGYSGAIVAGNLVTTGGGNISLSAQSNITINRLDAGSTGNVTVTSNRGVIIDGNGSAHNITGNVVSLSARTPDLRDAEINRDTAIAEFSANQAEAAAKLTANTILLDQQTSFRALEATNNSLLTNFKKAEADKQREFDDANRGLEVTRNVVDGLATAVNVATAVVTALEIPVGAAQAVPVSGDGGASAGKAIANTALAVATLALDAYERFELARDEGKAEEAANALAEAKAEAQAAQFNFDTVVAIRKTVDASVVTSKDALFRAETARDASLQIRRQAIAAYDLNQSIDSSAVKPLGISAGTLNVNVGRTVDSSLHLDAGTGNLGLGDINLAPGHDLFARAASGLISVNGTVMASHKLSSLLNTDGSPIILDRGVLDLDASGSIVDGGSGSSGQLVAADIVLRAGSAVGSAADALDLQGENLAVHAGAGINIANDTTANSALNITRVGSTTGVSGDGDITITTDGDLNLKELIEDRVLGTQHTITLTSTGGKIKDDNTGTLNLRAHRATTSSKDGIEFDSDVAELNASTQGAGSGNIVIREKDAATAKTISAGNGNVDIKSGGTLTVESISAAATDVTKGNISLDVTGDIHDDGVNTTVMSGRTLTLKATGVLGGNGATAANLRSLDTSVDKITATAAGVVNIDEANDVELTKISTTGDVTVQSLGGTLKVAEVLTNATGTTVTLFASGAITDVLDRTPAMGEMAPAVPAPNVKANKLALKAGTGIGTSDNALDVQVAEVEGESATGGIFLEDGEGDLAIADVTPGLGLSALNGLRATTSGDIKVKAAAGSLTQNVQVTATSGAIDLNAKTNLTASALVDTDGGTVSLTATEGSLTTDADAPINATGNISLLAKTDVTQNAGITSSAGNVGITATTGSITVSSGAPVSGSTGVTLLAAKNVTQSANISATSGNISVTATGLFNEVQNPDDPDADPILVYASDGNISVVGNVTTSVGTAGNVTYSAGNDLTTQTVSTASGNVSLTARKDVVLGNDTTASNGSVSATATTGSLTVDSGAPVSGSTGVTLLAAKNVMQNANISAAGGNISVTATGVQEENLDGDLVYTSGDITMVGNVTTSVSSSGNVTYSAGRGLTTQTVSTASGNVSLTAREDVVLANDTTAGNGTVSVTSTAGGITVAANAPVTGSGGVSLLAKTNVVQNANINATSGNISVTAMGLFNEVANPDDPDADPTLVYDSEGNITMGSGVTTSVGTAGNITYSAAKDVTLSGLSTADGEATVTATRGAIMLQTAPAINVSADALAATSALGIGTATDRLKTDIEKLTASVTGAGNIFVSESDAVELSRVSAANGNFSLTGGSITVDSVNVSGDADLTASGTGATISMTAGDADTPIDPDALIKASKLTLVAPGSINVTTDVTTVAAGISDTGDLTVRETDGVTLTGVSLFEGDVDVKAGGSILVQSVSADGDIKLDSAGAIERAANAATTAITGYDLTLSAATGIGNSSHGALTLFVDTIDGQTTAGDIKLSQADEVNVPRLKTGNGAVTLNVGTGDVILGAVAGTGTVTITATGGALLNDGPSAVDTPDTTVVEADALVLTAALDIGAADRALQTRAGSLAAQITEAGSVYVSEADGLSRADVTPGSSGTIDNIVLTSATGNLGIGALTTGNGTVAITAQAGSIFDADNSDTLNITAQRLVASASTGIGASTNYLDAAIDSLAATTDTGGIFIRHQGDSLSLEGDGGGSALTANNGAIGIITNGALLIEDALRADGAGGGVSLVADGPVTQNADISASRFVSVSSGSTIEMASDGVTGVTTQISGPGVISYSAPDNISISNLFTGSNGAVTLQSSSVTDNLPGRNVRTGFLELVSDDAGLPLVRVLLGDQATEAALVRLNYGVVGGTLAESRRFMDEVLRPLHLAGGTLANSALLAAFSAGSFSIPDENVGFSLDADGAWTFKQ